MTSKGTQYQDVAAAIVAIILTAGVVVLAIKSQDVPGAYATALGNAISWLFIRSIQIGAHPNA